MIRALLIAAVASLAATPAFALFCYGGPPGNAVVFEFEVGNLSESDRAYFYELRLRRMGIDARDTRMWNGCIQTFVTENGRFTMKLFDPWTLEEIPLG